MPRTGQIYVIAAPSGAGKSTLVNALCDKDPLVQLSISHTTRKIRPKETHGKEYYFVSQEQFEIMIHNNEFLEYAKVYQNYYGTNINTIKEFLNTGKDIILEIDWQGASQIKILFPQATLIFIAPPSLKVLRERLLKRQTDSISTIEYRLSQALEEISHAKNFDYLIINDTFDAALTDLCSIIRAPRNKTSNLLPKILQQFNFI